MLPWVKSVTFLFLCLSNTALLAEEFPTRPITIVVPFGAGGQADQTTRAVAKAMAKEIGQPVVVDNRPGASGLLGTEYVANAKPDGYTILIGSNFGLMGAPYLKKKLAYNPSIDLTPVHGIYSTDLVMAVNAAAPYKTLPEFIDYAKKNPGKLNFYSIGPGSLQHLAPEILMRDADISMTHIPYKTTASAVADMLTGTIDVMMDVPLNLGAQVNAGKFNALAVTSATRLKSFPNVKTFVEQGYPGVTSRSYALAVVPKNTPASIVERLDKVIALSLRDPEVVRIVEDQDCQVLYDLDHEKTAELISTESVTIKDIIQRAGIEPD